MNHPRGQALHFRQNRDALCLCSVHVDTTENDDWRAAVDEMEPGVKEQEHVQNDQDWNDNHHDVELHQVLFKSVVEMSMAGDIRENEGVEAETGRFSG